MIIMKLINTVWLRRVIKENKFVVVLTICAFLLRFWNLPSSFSFLGDQGRDALIVSDIFRKFDLVFIGPVTSVGNMYLGPLYYYFMLPFLFLSYPNPIGPVIVIALLGTLYVPLLFFLGKEMVGEKAALFAAFMATWNSTLVEYSRFSWNPNPAPIVSLIMIYAVFKAYKSSGKYWLFAIASLGVLVQLHYITLLACGGLGILWMYQLYSFYSKKEYQKIQSVVLISVLGLLLVACLYLPLLAFDFKHDWLNVRAFSSLLTSSENFVQSDRWVSFYRIVKIVKETHGRAMQMFFEVRIGQIRWLNSFLLITLVAFFISVIRKKALKEYQLGIHILLTFATVGIIGLSTYQHTVFAHYILYLFPVTALLLGVFFAYIWSKKWAGQAMVCLFFILFFVRTDVWRHLALPEWGVKDVEKVAKTISERVAQGEKYNIVLLSNSGDIDGQNYRYFLSTSDVPPVEIEKRGEIETLFIINEDKVLKKVVDSPVYEIVVFPNKEPAEVYQTFNGKGPEVTVLRK